MPRSEQSQSVRATIGAGIGLVALLAGLTVLKATRREPAPPPDDAAGSERLVETAKGLAAEGHVAAAMMAADQAKKRSPRNPSAWILKADLLQQATKGDEAYAELEEGYRVLPKNPEVLLSLLRHRPAYAPAGPACRHHRQLRGIFSSSPHIDRP